MTPLSFLGLSFFQSVLAAIAGVASFGLVGICSIAGKKGRTSTLTLSRAIFGKQSNIAPTAFCWINLMGWEAVNLMTGTLTLAALIGTFGIEESSTVIAISLVLFGGLTVAVSMLGQHGSDDAEVGYPHLWHINITGCRLSGNKC